MEVYRTVNRLVEGKNAQDGAGVKLVRVFGYRDVEDFDPFLMLDAFDSHNPEDYTKGFPWHPHRGIETITYLIEGNVEHGDSLGNNGVILDGDCQWMTAGSGIIHQEMPRASSRMLGVQLWLNLPAKYKMTEPKYRDIISKNVPIVEDNKSKIRIISGSYKGITGAIQGDYVKPLFIDVEVNGGEEFTLQTDYNQTLFVYIIGGKGTFSPDHQQYIPEKRAVLFNGGDKLYVKACEDGIRFILLMAKALKEPVAWGGPIVMNTKEELDQAFMEIEDGSFIKK